MLGQALTLQFGETVCHLTPAEESGLRELSQCLKSICTLALLSPELGRPQVMVPVKQESQRSLHSRADLVKESI